MPVLPGKEVMPMKEEPNTVQTPEENPDLNFSMEIDGRIFTVRVYFKSAGETMQRKIERLIERDVLAGGLDAA